MEKESYQELEQRIAEYEARVKDLEDINEELTDFIENAALPLHWVNGEGIITWANQAELTALGYERDEYIGQPISNFHADQDIISDILKRLTNYETLHNYRARLICNDGSIKHVLISSNVLEKEGKFIHTRCFTRDITPMVLEEQRKNDFVSMVSHELKTPLTSILSYVQVMLSKISKSEDTFISQALARTEKQAKSMTRMINDFLNMSRLEEAKVQLNIESFDLNELLYEVAEEIEITNQTHHIEYTPACKLSISADRAKLSQVLDNLISNAIKYSAASSNIVVGCEQLGTMVKVYVQDQGIGISEDDQKLLFERFYRVESKATKHTTGFGIGLYLVAEILRYHHSKIEVTSSPGKGSTFYFLMPLEQ